MAEITYDDAADEITSAEELDAILADTGEDDDKDGDSDKSKDSKEPEREVDDITSGEDLDKRLSNDDDDDKKPKETGKDIKADIYGEGDIASAFNRKQETDDKVDPKQFKNSVEYVNARFKLGLKTENLGDINKEQESEVIGDLIERQTQGFNKIISQYVKINDLVKDPEVADFLKAKAQGKNLTQYVSDLGYSGSSLDDEALVRADLKSTYPNMDKEKIDKLIDGYKDKELLEDMASNIREKNQNKTEAEKKAEEQRAKIEEEQFMLQRQREVENFRNYTKGIKSVFGVPVTDQMRERVVAASTEIDDEGETYLDKVLKTDPGVYLATMGVLFLQDLLNAAGSKEGNIKAKRLADKLFDSTEKLQSSSRTDSPTNEELVKAANQF